jgi:hypothetical protein
MRRIARGSRLWIKAYNLRSILMATLMLLFGRHAAVGLPELFSGGFMRLAKTGPGVTGGNTPHGLRRGGIETVGVSRLL